MGNMKLVVVLRRNIVMETSRYRRDRVSSRGCVAGAGTSPNLDMGLGGRGLILVRSFCSRCRQSYRQAVSTQHHALAKSPMTSSPMVLSRSQRRSRLCHGSPRGSGRLDRKIQPTYGHAPSARTKCNHHSWKSKVSRLGKKREKRCLILKATCMGFIVFTKGRAPADERSCCLVEAPTVSPLSQLHKQGCALPGLFNGILEHDLE
jgi:hypothetical protein